MSELEYIISYCIFVYFFVFIATMGAPTFLPPEAVAELRSIQVTRTLHTPSFIQNMTCGWGIFDFICTILGGLVKLVWNILLIIGAFWFWIWDTIQILFVLMKFSSSIQWVTFLIIIPLTIGLAYVIIRIARGGG